MNYLDDILDLFNWVDRLEGLLSSFINSDWHGIGDSQTPVDLFGSWTFHIRRDVAWTGGEVERFLRHYGIVAWGRRLTGDHYILSVKPRQAEWAEYLLLRRGIAIDAPYFNPQNATYAQRFAPGDRPPAWGDRPDMTPDFPDFTVQSNQDGFFYRE